MRVRAAHNEIWQLVDESDQMDVLVGELEFAEGPVWHPDGYLLFSDVRANRRYRWSGTGGLELLAEPTGHANGMTLDAMGRLLLCEGITPAVVRSDPDGRGHNRLVLASRYCGRLLNSPNDIVVRSDGRIFFTDPWSRARLEERVDDGCECSLEKQLEFQAVFSLTPAGELSVVADDLLFPNGLCFSPDERVLYVNDTPTGAIHALAVGADGTLEGRDILAEGVRDETGHVDGMKCDTDGNIWVTGPGGIWVFSPGGVPLGVVEVPERVGNLHWGGAAWEWLYVTASDKVYRFPTKTSGRREPFMTIT